MSAPNTGIRLQPNNEILAVLREISDNLKVQNERLARLEARDWVNTTKEPSRGGTVSGGDAGFRSARLDPVIEDNVLDEISPVERPAPNAEGSQRKESKPGFQDPEEAFKLIEQDLRDAGRSEEEIESTLRDLRTPMGREKPTYTRMSRKYISTETLDRYKVDWEFDSDPSFVLLKRWVPEAEQDFLWDHTKRLRDKRGTSFIEPYAEESSGTEEESEYEGMVKVRYLSEIIPREQRVLKGFLQAPYDHRIWLGFIGSEVLPPHTTYEYKRIRDDWLKRHLELRMRKIGSASSVVEQIIWEMNHVDRRPGVNFMIRDSDLHSNNRLYRIGNIVEYSNGENPMARYIGSADGSFQSLVEEPWDVSGGVRRMRGTNGILVSPVTWRVENGELQLDPLPQPYFAPWIRTILLEGLESLWQPIHMIPGRPPFADLPYLASEDRTIHQHLAGGSYSLYQWPPARATVTLQFSWFKILPRSRLDPPEPRSFGTLLTWRKGQLYGRHDSTLCEQTLTIHCVYRSAADPASPDGNLGNERYWTTLLLTPPGFYTEQPRYIDTLLIENPGTLPMCLLSRALETIESLTRDWGRVFDYAESLLVENDSIFRPQDHDDLLFDDDSFSQSRALWWVVDASEIFGKSIEEAETTYRSFRDVIWEPYCVHLLKINIQTRERYMMDSAESLLSNFSALRLRASTLKARAVELRAGLFSASSVVEGRAATRLAENVKLLTYVSIFYAPLTFVTSLSQITPLPLLLYLFIPFALGTYLVVMNLNALVLWAGVGYHKFRARVVEKMIFGRESGRWREIGERFRRFEPKRKEPKPSEWLVLWFFVRWFFWGRFAWRRRRESVATESSEDSADVRVEYVPKRRRGWWRGRKKGGEVPVGRKIRDGGARDEVGDAADAEMRFKGPVRTETITVDPKDHGKGKAKDKQEKEVKRGDTE